MHSLGRLGLVLVGGLLAASAAPWLPKRGEGAKVRSSPVSVRVYMHLCVRVCFCTCMCQCVRMRVSVWAHACVYAR
jgi:hypothetical protein